MLHALGVQWNDRKYWWRAGGCCGAWDSIFASAQTGVGSGRNAQKKQKMAVLFLNEQDYGSSISSLAVDGDPNLRLAPEDSRSASAASCSMNLLDSGMR